MLAANTPQINQFNGINNVTDPLRLGMGWLVDATNVNISDTGSIVKRDGYTLSRAGAFESAYSTLDFQRSYLATATGIQNFAGENIVALSSTAPMFWCEINKQVFFNNGTDSGVIMPDDAVLPWAWTLPKTPALSAVTGNLPAGTYMVSCTSTLPDGRETGATEPVYITLTAGQALQISWLTQGCNVYIAPADSEVFQLYGKANYTALTFNSSPDTLGRDLLNAFLDPLPPGTDVIQAWRGRVYASEPMLSNDQSVVWMTEALGFHLFNLNSGFFLVPGRVLAMAPTKDALIVATGERIYAYTGDRLDQLADYGVVPGKSWDTDGDRLLMWTTRGLCSAMPFENLTEKQVSVAPGDHVAGCVVRSGGQKRFLACLQQGKEAFNAR